MNKSYKYVGYRKKHERSFFMYRNQLGAMTIKKSRKEEKQELALEINKIASLDLL